MQSKLCQPKLFSAIPVARLIILRGTARKAVHKMAAVELAPQGLAEGEADTSPEGAPTAQTEETRAGWCAIGAWEKGTLSTAASPLTSRQRR